MSTQEKIEHLFRHEYGKIVAALISRYSSSKIDLIEDSVQEALLKAMQMWGYQTTPDNPSAWLYRVANNYLIDQLRRGKKSVDYDLPEDSFTTDSEVSDSSITSNIEDEQLKMIFACCHTSLNSTEQIMLSLKLMGGLSIREIASALMKKEEAVKKAITRAKTKFKNEIGKIEVPSFSELKKRLDAVLKVIYLMFNEGYKATEGEKLINRDICLEAIRLGEILLQNKNCNTSELNAILALMYFNSARFDARTGSEGEMITLEFQDRSKWDKDLIAIGFYYLNESSKEKKVSTYHIEAAITSVHISANLYKETDWEMILSLYDVLMNYNDSPAVALNRLVAVIKVKGIKDAQNETERIEKKYNMADNYLFQSIKGNVEYLSGNMSQALNCYRKAIELCKNKIEKEFLKRKLKLVKSRIVDNNG